MGDRSDRSTSGRRWYFRNDVVRGVLGRLGIVGVSLVACALILGAIAGGVVVHRLQAAPAASSTQERGQNADEQGGGAAKASPPKSAHTPSPEPGEQDRK